MTVQPGLCGTWSESQIVGFLTHRLNSSLVLGHCCDLGPTHWGLGETDVLFDLLFYLETDALCGWLIVPPHKASELLTDHLMTG